MLAARRGDVTLSPGGGFGGRSHDIGTGELTVLVTLVPEPLGTSVGARGIITNDHDGILAALNDHSVDAAAQLRLVRYGRFRVAFGHDTSDLGLPRHVAVLANLQMGSGDWITLPDASTPFPAHFYVDYIRVYQHN